jgi:hypothetical protein
LHFPLACPPCRIVPADPMSKDGFLPQRIHQIPQVGATVLTCDHNNDPTGSTQTLTVLSPTMLPLNPFQSFVLYGPVAAGTTHPDNSDLYPCRSMFGVLKPPTNERPAVYHTRASISPQLRRSIMAQHPKARPCNDSQYSTSPRLPRHDDR